MTRSSVRGLFLCLGLTVITAAPALAGGPLLIFDAASQQPFYYPAPLQLYTDNDPLFSVTVPVTGETAAARVADGIAQWTNVPTATFVGTVAGDFASIGLPDINVNNVGQVIGTYNGGGYHIIFDHNGLITGALAGPGVLGFSTPEFAVDGSPELTESYAVLNGTTVFPGDTEALDWQGVITHELGHGINLAHTQCNGAIDIFGDDESPGGCPRPYAGSPESNDVETMYPFINLFPGGTGEAQGSVDLNDDISAISDVYPAPGWPEDFATIAGTIVASDGVTPVTGVNVIARNVADPWRDCSSMLSGAFTQGQLGPDGRYVLNGLTPGADYVIYIDDIAFGGFSTPPARPFPGPEEYWNGANESADPLIDHVCEYVTATPAAGATFAADIIIDLGVFLGDDDFTSIRLPFSFEFCQRLWTRVFVGSNGFLTFGRGDTDFIDSVSDLLDGPPRIAALWADLDPTRGGAIMIDETPGAWTINYIAIPEFLGSGANTFSVTLRDDGTFEVLYDELTVTDALVGRSEGLGVPDPGPSDLSAAPQPIGDGAGTVYEAFQGNNDLALSQLEFGHCAPFVFVFDPGLPGTCYASTGSSGLGGALLTVDPATGVGTLIGQTGRSQVPALAINSARELWGSTGGGASQLLRISASDGVSRVAAEIRNLVSGLPLPFVDALAFDSADVLYGVDATNRLWTIDTTTGIATEVGRTGLVGPPFLVGLAFDPTTGRLYASTGGQGGADALYELDPATGAATLVGNTGLGSGAIPDLAFVDNGDLFASKKVGSAFQWVRIDKSTGAGTLIGDTGFTSVSGLTWSAYDTTTAELDIKPGSCPNPFNLAFFDDGRGNDHARGARLPVAIVGTPEFDVQEIDVSTVRLEGVAPIVTRFRDVTGTSNADDDNRHQDNDDDVRQGDDDDGWGRESRYDDDDSGWRDRRRDNDEREHGRHDDDDDTLPPDGEGLCPCDRCGDGGDGVTDLLAFFYTEDIAAALAPGERGEERLLMLTGFLRSGQPFVASDCIVFVGRRRAEGAPGDDTADRSSRQPTLDGAFPNPFNPVTRIGYELPATSDVMISIYDVKGRLIERLVSGVKPAGHHVVEWDAHGLASGIYFYRMVAGDFTQTRKLILLK